MCVIMLCNIFSNLNPNEHLTTGGREGEGLEAAMQGSSITFAGIFLFPFIVIYFYYYAFLLRGFFYKMPRQ